MTFTRIAALGGMTLLVSACTLENGNYTTQPAEQKASEASAKVAAPIAASQVTLSEGPAKGAHEVIGPISVDVNKLTAFHPNPTPELARAALQKKAAEIGANAVVNVEITGPRVTLLSWGAVQAKGDAIRY